MMIWFKSHGYLKINRGGNVEVSVSRDLAPYYLWFVKRELNHGFRYRLGDDKNSEDPFFNRYGMGIVEVYENLNPSHITVVSKKNRSGVDFGRVKKYVGRRFDFEYSAEIKVGGWKSSFWNFYLPVRSIEIEGFRGDCGVKMGNNGFLHITLGNTKNLGGWKEKPPLPNNFVD